PGCAGDGCALRDDGRLPPPRQRRRGGPPQGAALDDRGSHRDAARALDVEPAHRRQRDRAARAGRDAGRRAHRGDAGDSGVGGNRVSVRYSGAMARHSLGSRGPLLLVSGLAGVALIGHMTAGRGAPEGSPTMVVAPATSRARHCAQYKPTTLRALEQGAQRLVLVVHAFTPPEPPDGTLVVWHASDAKATPKEVARVAIHPV